MTATAAEVRSARWVAGLFVMALLTQRVGIPGVPNIGMLTLLVVGWTGLAAARRVVVLERTRLLWWLAACGVTGMVMLAQHLWVPQADISVNAWILVIVVWFPFTYRLVDTGSAGYLRLLRYVTTITSVLAAATLAMVGLQLLGLRYVDWFSSVVPEGFRLEGFNTFIPIFYGSPVYKGMAWIGLEPSITSAFLGLGLLAAVLCRARVWQVVLLILGLVATVSGSGVVLVIVGVVVLLLSPARRLLAPYWFLGILTVLATTFTTFGEVLLSRSTEVQSDNSSTALRSILPYDVLLPDWIGNAPGVLLGLGPGSSQRAVNESGLVGLLVPSPLKIFFEYGLIAGVLLAGLLLICYWGGPSRTFAIPLVLSLWLLQPGVTTTVITVPVLMLVTLWSPRRGPQIEDLSAAPAGSDDRTASGDRPRALSDLSH